MPLVRQFITPYFEAWRQWFFPGFLLAVLFLLGPVLYWIIKKLSRAPGDSRDQALETITLPEVDDNQNFIMLERRRRELFKTLLRFLEYKEWIFKAHEDKLTVEIPYKAKNGSWNCYAELIPEREALVFYSMLSNPIPESKRAEVAEFITRANSRLLLGNFELDFSDGELGYKTSIDVEGGQLTFNMLNNMLYANVITLDIYLPGIMNVLYGNLSPQEAIDLIEEQ
ncbi:MAG: YbjN domain-containing protein [candidate division FCPU426 bacterium]